MGLRIAVVHEWLMRGGSEKAVEAILGLFPTADLFCTLFDPDVYPNARFAQRRIQPTWLQRIPTATKNYPLWLPLMPAAMRSLRLSPYEVLISSSHAFAKSVRKTPRQLHICYCYTPPRYLWDLSNEYENRSSPWLAFGHRCLRPILRRLDKQSARHVDVFFAVSGFVRDRIRKTYGRDACVVYPPCDVDSFPLVQSKEDYFVTVARFVPYKRVDLMIEAFRRLGSRLVVVGDGPLRKELERAAPPNVTLLGWVEQQKLVRLICRARAFVFAAVEDFGMAPVEAQAAGTPVIAYGQGGVVETVRPLGRSSPTGLLYSEQSSEALVNAVREFEVRRSHFDGQELRKNAERFSLHEFRKAFLAAYHEAEERWHAAELGR